MHDYVIMLVSDFLLAVSVMVSVFVLCKTTRDLARICKRMETLLNDEKPAE